MNATTSDACSIAETVRSGKRAAEHVVMEALERAQRVGKQLNCYTALFERKALDDALEIDKSLRAGKTVGPLAGVPIAVKNLFDVAGVVTIAGSKIDQDKPAAIRDAHALQRLRDAGAILIGALGMDEYAYGFTNENSHYGPVRNPHDTTRTPGGSSGGSGAAVGSSCVPLALGTDTNGSVRVPASLCGVFGLKPTFGRVSRTGVTPFTPSLDHVGFLTRSARDAALAFDITHGHDAVDPTSSSKPPEPVLPTIGKGVVGLRVARATGYFVEEATEDALDALDVVARALGSVSEVEVAEAKTARHAAMILSAVEGSALHLDDLRARAEDFDPMTRDRFLAGAFLAGDSYVRSQLFRQAFKTSLAQLFAHLDILVAPATPMVAPKLGQTEIEIDGVTLPSRAHLGKFTQPISFVGLPVVVVPLRTKSSLPIGVQLIGAPYSEATLLRAAHFLETTGIVRALSPPH